MFYKLIIFVLVFAVLFLVKECFMFYKAFKIGEKNITTPRLWGIGFALSFIITIIITGLNV